MRDESRLRAVYGRRAARYDRTTAAQRWLGFRNDAILRLARQMLDVRTGDDVVDIGTGTGLNLPGLCVAAGPTGSVTAIDLSPDMLRLARRRVAAVRDGASVTFIETDAVDAPWRRCDAVLATFTLVLQSRHKEVLDHAWAALRPGGRLVVADLAVPSILRPFVLLIGRAYGHTWSGLGRRPVHHLATLAGHIETRRRFFGLVVVAAAEKA